MPQFYLAGYTASGARDGALWVIDQKTGNGWRSSPQGAGHERDFYRVDVPGVAPDAIESAFAKLESKAAPVVRRVIETRTLPSGDEFAVLMNFVAGLSVKIPAIRHATDRSMEQLAKKTMRVVLSTRERWDSTLARIRADGVDLGEAARYESMRSFVDRDEFTITVSNDWHINLMLDLIDGILPFLAARAWSIVTVDSSVGHLICSDRPVSLLWSPGTEMPGWWPAGHGMRNTQLTVPLGKDVGLLGEFDGDGAPIHLDRHRLAGFNSRTGTSAERFVYSSADEFVWIQQDGAIGGAIDLLRMLRAAASAKGEARTPEAGSDDEERALDSCGWCDAPLPPDDREETPEITNDVAWARLAREHAADCEWITTRGFQLSK